MTGAVLALGAAVLAHEICLLRVLSVAWWHHAASLVVSVALLGFGAAGTLLALAPRLASRAAVGVAALLYAVSIPTSLELARRLDFNILEAGWDSAQWLRLLAVESVFAVPFLLAALGVFGALKRRARSPAQLYAFNLAGSGLGALAAPLMLAWWTPAASLRAVALLGCAGAACAGRGRLRIGAALAAAALALLPFRSLPMSPFKDLAAAPGKRVLETRQGPRGRVDLAEVASLHFARGLSLVSAELPESRLGLYLDGHLVAARERPDETAYLDHTVGALPRVLLGPGPETLVLGVGPGLARASLVVDENPDLLALSGGGGVASEPRAFLERTRRHWPLIVHHVPRLHSAVETPLLTVEGLRLAWRRADAVALSCDLATPPRAGLKLLATAERITPFIVAARSADRLCLVMLHRPPREEERRSVLRFCEENGFDPVRPVSWRTRDPHHETATPLLAPQGDYPYDVRPATDARPYFFRFFRWSRLGDLFDREKTTFVEWPYVSLIVALVEVTVLGLLAMGVPLLLSRAARAPALLFCALGAGFMLVEMAFLQRALVRVGGPVLAAAAVLGGFLVGAGVGSALSVRLGRPLGRAALAVVALGPLGWWLLPRAPLAAAAICAAVALPMGMPFPAALAGLPERSVGWALAFNGIAAVAAAAAAPLLSSTLSIPATAGLGLGAYLVVAWKARRP